MSGIQMALLGAGSTEPDVLTIPSGTITISESVSKTETDPYALFILGGGFSGLTTGEYGKSIFGTNTPLGTWISPATSYSNYQFFATQTATNGQGIDYGVYGTWTTLSQFYGWGIEFNNGVNPLYNVAATRSLTVQIRKVGDTVVLGTFTVDISATKTDP